MKKLTKLDLQDLSEKMHLVPEDEQRHYLGMGSWNPDPSYILDPSNFNPSQAYCNDCFFAALAAVNTDTRNNQEEINELAENWAMTHRAGALQQYINAGMTSREAAQEFLTNNPLGAGISYNDAYAYYRQVRSSFTNGALLIMGNSVDAHFVAVTSYNEQTGEFHIFDASRDGAANRQYVDTKQNLERLYGEDFQVWEDDKFWRANAVYDEATEEWIPNNNNNSSGGSFSDGSGSGSSGSNSDGYSGYGSSGSDSDGDGGYDSSGSGPYGGY